MNTLQQQMYEEVRRRVCASYTDEDCQWYLDDRIEGATIEVLCRLRNLDAVSTAGKEGAVAAYVEASKIHAEAAAAILKPLRFEEL